MPMDKITFPQPQILEAARSFFRSSDSTHGFDHALDIEKRVREIAEEPEFTHINLDKIILSAAALFHDTGYLHYNPLWLPGQTEHVRESIEITRKILSTIPPFDTDSNKLRQVCYLIKHHDQTNHMFPIYQRRKGFATLIGAKEEQDWPYLLPGEINNIHLLLAILREADGLSGTGKAGALRTLGYSLSRGIRLFSTGNSSNAWLWEESAVGNVRLAAKRALLDSYTKNGKKIAWEGYQASEELIQQKAYESGIEYQPEIHLTLLNKPINHMTNYDEFRISRVYPWLKLVNTLRKVKLQGDPRLNPYKDAVIESRIVKIDELFPTAYYISMIDLRKVERLYKNLLNQYALSIFDLSDIIEVSQTLSKKRTYRVRTSPPIVEIYTETQGEYKGKTVLALVDGLHRCFLAKQLGLEEIRVVTISALPGHLPLVPLPLSWNDVKIYDDIPDNLIKRDYRFPTLGSFPDISSFSNSEISEKNFKYFFYRDLANIGSEGVRKRKNEK